MSEKEKSFYITTTLPYVNSDPHIGHAFEVVQADAFARYKRQMGFDVFFNTGTDEHGLKIYEKALEGGKTPQEHVDKYVQSFYELKDSLNLSYDRFIRTTHPEHIKAAQEFWSKCFENGDIYKKKYKAKYCVGCELERHDSELENGRCFFHPNLEIQEIEEENYFFALSKYQEKLVNLYEKNQNFVIPESRQKEIRTFVEGGLNDFSISRLKEKMPWGVPIPGDDDHIMYVWFDALVNYISTLGWPNNEEKFDKFWIKGTPVQLAGKDNLRQQSAMWQAMLMSAGVAPSETILIHGFITSDGEKMSKSRGNVINPFDVVKEYNTDALRYYLLRELHPYEDSDFTDEKFKEVYTANLVNGVGNLTNRIMKLAEDYLDGPVDISENQRFFPNFIELMDKYDYRNAIDSLWKGMQMTDEKIQELQPFKVVKEDLEKGKEMITELVGHLADVEYHLRPFLPETAEKIKLAIEENKKPEEPIFPRKD